MPGTVGVLLPRHAVLVVPRSANYLRHAGANEDEAGIDVGELDDAALYVVADAVRAAFVENALRRRNPRRR